MQPSHKKPRNARSTSDATTTENRGEAGLPNTSNGGLLTMDPPELTHPEQLAELRANPGWIPQAVEELMRFVPLGSGAGFPGTATEDVELGGVLVRAGGPVMVSTAAANRDESVFSGPELLDLTRPESSHIGFGHGPHHCLGAQLARMELQVALNTLLTRLPGLRFATSAEDVEWKRGMLVRGPQKTLLTWQGG